MITVQFVINNVKLLVQDVPVGHTTNLSDLTENILICSKYGFSLEVIIATAAN